QLPAGQYRLLLLQTSLLKSSDGVGLPPTGQDQRLADFTVNPLAFGLSGATNLGTLGGSVVTATGALDFVANPVDLKLYQITFAPGHFWRLGAGVLAQRLGRTLNAALALFDAQGHVIAIDDTGLPNSPNDPYLFAGLPAGTYYLGVSGAGNLPGLPGGYD